MLSIESLDNAWRAKQEIGEAFHPGPGSNRMAALLPLRDGSHVDRGKINLYRSEEGAEKRMVLLC